MLQLCGAMTLVLSANPPRTFKVAIDGDISTGFLAENWGSTDRVAGPKGFTLQGNGRSYAAARVSGGPGDVDWGDFAYRRFELLDRQFQFEVDLSRVGCGCNAALYLVAMPEHPEAHDAAYCDIQGPEGKSCLEIDILEGNAKALQATIHTTNGHGWDGKSCNADGCLASLGKTPESARLYGPESKDGIDSSRPFTVSATFANGGAFNVMLTQGSEGGSGAKREVQFFDADAVASGSNVLAGQPTPVPQDDRERMRGALERGMVLVLSLWTAEDLSWLDGGCEEWVAQGRQKCGSDNLADAQVTFSGFRTTSIPPPPSPPPPPPTPPSPPPPTSPPVATTPPVSVLAMWGGLLSLTLGFAFVCRRQRAEDERDSWPGKRPKASGKRSSKSKARKPIAPTTDDDDDEEEEEDDDREDMLVYERPRRTRKPSGRKSRV